MSYSYPCKKSLSVLPEFSYHTNNRLSTFDISLNEIKELIKLLNVNKAHGPDEISVHMIKLCGDSICNPLLIIFRNCKHRNLSEPVEGSKCDSSAQEKRQEIGQ